MPHSSGHIDNLYEFRTGDFEGTTGSCVFRIARNPQRIDAETPRKREQQHQGTRRIVVAAICRVNAVADVARIVLNMWR